MYFLVFQWEHNKLHSVDLRSPVPAVSFAFETTLCDMWHLIDTKTIKAFSFYLLYVTPGFDIGAEH